MINQSQIRNLRVETLTEIKAISTANTKTICYCDETRRLYRYVTSAPTFTANDETILTTGNGGDTRWIDSQANVYAYNHTGPIAMIKAQTGAADSFPKLSLQNDAREWILQVQGSDSDKLYVYDNTAGAVRMVITASGDIGMGETAPDSKLEVNGTIHATNLDGGAINLTVNASGQIVRDPSDERLKENITEMEIGLNELLRLKPRKYKWKPEAGMGDGEEFGLIAQESGEVNQKLVTVSSATNDNFQGINQHSINALLVKSIQDQQKIIHDLHEKIKELSRSL